jgi:hypothetical protein
MSIPLRFRLLHFLTNQTDNKGLRKQEAVP